MQIPIKRKNMDILKQSTSYLGLAELPAFEMLNLLDCKHSKT